ncbi:MAG: hypothetical protein AB7U20_06555 [Planctomycetaceae bacterium]
MRRITGWFISAAAGVLLLGSLSAARGEEGIGGVLRFLLGGNRGQEAQPAFRAPQAVVEDVPAEFENQFTPHLQRLMNTELHFAHKVCDLNAEQFAKLRESGRLTIAAIAKTYGKQQNQHQSSDWPDARELLTDAFQKQIDATLSADDSARYRDEIAGRRQARQEAAREMMTMLIDRKLSLTPDQYEHVGAVIDEHWEPGWSRNMQVYLYDEYAPLPGENVLKPLLSERQRGVWVSRTNYGQISFGWEQDLGLMAPWGEIGELAIEVPVSAAKEPPAVQNEDAK